MGIRDFQIEVINSNGTFQLNDYSSWFITSLAGLGIPANNRFIERAALQHGAFNMGFRLQPRFFDMTLFTNSTSEQDYWDTRDEINRIFAPTDDLMSLKFTTGTSVKQIDCAIRGVLAMDSNDRKGLGQKIGVQFIAPDPLFYDPNRVVYSIGGFGTGGLTFAMPVPFFFGQASIDSTIDLNNTGSWESYPQIEVVGPVNNFIITNETTGKKLDFTGLNLAAANERFIDTAFSAKTVVDQTGANKISDLTDDSDLTTFSLVAGSNSISISGSSATSATRIFIRYYLRYIGI